MAEIIVLNNGILETYNSVEDVPQKFDNLIRFIPDYPEGPHTHEEHEEMGKFVDILKELISRETNGN